MRQRSGVSAGLGTNYPIGTSATVILMYYSMLILNCQKLNQSLGGSVKPRLMKGTMIHSEPNYAVNLIVSVRHTTVGFLVPIVKYKKVGFLVPIIKSSLIWTSPEDRDSIQIASPSIAPVNYRKRPFSLLAAKLAALFCRLTLSFRHLNSSCGI